MSEAVTANILDGRELAEEVRRGLAGRIAALADEGRPVRLDAVICGGNDAGSVYAASQARTCGQMGIEYRLHELPEDVSQQQLLDVVAGLNDAKDVHAIMVHMPLPDGIDPDVVQSFIHPDKDVEGVNPANIGNVIYGRRSLLPCTALAVMTMIESTGVPIKGRMAVCVGASRIVGRPVAVLLMQAEATVVSTNVHTPDLASMTRQADIVVSAAGVPSLVTGDMIRPGAVVIDVGINRIKDPSTGKARTVGDVDLDTVSRVAAWASPVPGGVGPVTVAMLLRNTVEAAERSV
ncbi:MAG: bifunctional 5,10-methylenetetrahydrofolate dehydrogenase/5,10-methenyltetrahydrofolate cyclohydrolase [Planctomycetota bacterium]|nr:bifunctional 5,10-methylenetetrahydrofolate dehydrogenase/5,10-methenyltetrahydrofolate cyclohydrolase [Planctomycetota bacterium]